MRHQVTQPDDSNILLMGIREGMPVYDLMSHKLGKVKYVRFPDKTLDDEEVIDEISVQNAPDPVRQRLLEVGFMCVDRGLLYKDYYVLADQIEGVVDQEVYLKLLRDELLTL